MGIQALCLFLHRVDTEAGPHLDSTQRRPSQQRALPPAPREQGQPGAPRAQPGRASLPVLRTSLQARQAAEVLGAPSSPPLPEHRQGEAHVAPPWTQVGGGNPGGPALDTGVGGAHAAPLWGAHGLPCLGHRSGVGTQVALPWTQDGCWGTAHGLPWLGSQNTDALAGNHTAVS